jgi:hypothetical protein
LVAIPSSTKLKTP